MSQAMEIFGQFRQAVEAAEAHVTACRASFEEELAASRGKHRAAEKALADAQSTFDEAVAQGDDGVAAAMHAGLAVLGAKVAVLLRTVEALEATRAEREALARREAAPRIEKALHGPGREAISAAENAVRTAREALRLAEGESRAIQNFIATVSASGAWWRGFVVDEESGSQNGPLKLVKALEPCRIGEKDFEPGSFVLVAGLEAVPDHLEAVEDSDLPGEAAANLEGAKAALEAGAKAVLVGHAPRKRAPWSGLGPNISGGVVITEVAG